MNEKKVLGNLGEDIACKFILDKGFITLKYTAGRRLKY